MIKLYTLSSFVERIQDILYYMKEPLIVGILLSLCAAIIGVILVLKRYSMIGDGLSHVAFGAVAVALALNTTPIYIAIPVVVFAAYILLRLGENSKLKGDAAIALVSSSALAIGFLVGSLSDGFSTDISSYMFGSITTATKTDLYYIIPITFAILIYFIFCYNRIFAVTFDEGFARATGTHTRIYSIMLAILTAIIIVIGMRIMGTLLISSLIIFPALTSMRLFTRFRAVIISSSIISVVCFLIAFFVFTDYSSASSIVIINLIFFTAFSLIAFVLKRIKRG